MVRARPPICMSERPTPHRMSSRPKRIPARARDLKPRRGKRVSAKFTLMLIWAGADKCLGEGVSEGALAS